MLLVRTNDAPNAAAALVETEGSLEDEVSSETALPEVRGVRILRWVFGGEYSVLVYMLIALAGCIWGLASVLTNSIESREIDGVHYERHYLKEISETLQRIERRLEERK